ncbi:MAG TPA: hypothetical protein VGG14_01625 [Candidatus Sulfotelmatobacter sp.]
MTRPPFNRITRPFLALLFLSATFLSAAVAVQTQPSNATSRVVTFTLDFPASTPSHYAISVDSNGHASYESTAKVADDSDPDTYTMEFVMTTADRDRIFEWAKQANYFSGKLDSGNRKLAFTGDKVLSYQDGEHSFTVHYNFSTIEPVRQLTTLFQKMASTLEYGRQLTYDHRYQKLALDEVLKQMEMQSKNGDLSEIQSLAPILNEIVADSSVINVVRARAKELIQTETSTVDRH